MRASTSALFLAAWGCKLSDSVETRAGTEDSEQRQPRRRPVAGFARRDFAQAGSGRRHTLLNSLGILLCAVPFAHRSLIYPSLSPPALYSPASLSSPPSQPSPSLQNKSPRLQLIPTTPAATMTVMTVVAPVPSPFNPAASRPRVSSPLAASAQARPVPSRQHSFPTSRPLRPFPSLAINSKLPARKPVKIIEPPANFKGTFVLSLTQAELSRQD
ncbi:hypothetical protein L226DRAFT_564412 [Lentinus tigrinus ALCF2SS1-7]|uniref:uncharacterized protein n=1 Tax=Lentinus tigrinus ALCF2SS1-7 TaxID=1328758 RepID=UPI001165E4BB|nr:hypothetical protein L226DRAFT_564412 [Lentinus tigrinus ALCF2SS1-7]